MTHSNPVPHLLSAAKSLLHAKFTAGVSESGAACRQVIMAISDLALLVAGGAAEAIRTGTVQERNLWLAIQPFIANQPLQSIKSGDFVALRSAVLALEPRAMPVAA